MSKKVPEPSFRWRAVCHGCTVTFDWTTQANASEAVGAHREATGHTMSFDVEPEGVLL